MVAQSKLARKAEAEVAAFGNRQTAEDSWRRAWWDMNYTAAETPIPHGQQKEVLGPPAKTLGVKVEALAARRNLALRVEDAVRNSDLAYRMPPRYAQEWMRWAKGAPLTKAVAQQLMKWDADDNFGLRDIASALGAENPPSWQTDKREGKPTPTPQQVVEAIRENAHVRQAVAQAPDVTNALHEERVRATAERVQRMTGTQTQPEKNDPDDEQFQRFMNIDQRLGDTRRAMRGVVASLKGYAPSEDEAQRWTGLAREIIILANGVVDELQGITQFNDELTALLEMEDKR